MSRRGRGARKGVRGMGPSSLARQGGRATDVTGQAAVMASGPSSTTEVPAMARLMPSPPMWATMPFGPGTPLDPVPINPVRSDSGRPEPRLYEYPVTWNLSTSSQRLVPWSILRNAADGVSMFRRCIEVRKDHIRGLDWDIVIGQDALDAAQRKADRAERAAKKSKGDTPVSPADQATTSPTSPAAAVPAANPGAMPSPPPAVPTPGSTSGGSGAPASPGAGAPDQDTPASGRAAVEDEMRDRLAPAIDAAKKFMKVPDRGNGLTFDRWVGQLLEEVFVLDALAIYPRYTAGGDLWSLEIVDGSTIKPLLDERGGRPLPPYPAYQQVVYGFPRGEFVASVSETDGPNGPDVQYDGTVYPSDQLIYTKRVDRVWSPYGLSAVEQALDDGSLYLKRHLWMMSEYTEGTTVSGLFSTAEATNWSPEQLLEFEIAFNRMYQGQNAERHSARFLPPGVLPLDNGQSTGSDAIAEKYKPEYDMHLLKLMVSHFDTTLPEIGFTDAGGGGLGSEGYHEGQAAVQNRKRLPIIRFVESLVTAILHDHFGSPDELEFKFLGLDDEDEPSAAELDMKRQAAGITTLNEERDKLGLARYEFPEADMPYISTGRGVVFLEGALAASQPVPAGFMEGPPMPPKPGDAPAGASSPPAPGPKPAASTAPPAGAPAQPTAVAVPAPAAKLAEVAAYRKWLRKGARGRPFRWEHHEPAEVEALTKAGDADPKAPWPGWSRDLAVMEHYAPRLSRALTGAIGVPTLAARWAEHGGSADTARAWLGEELDHGARLAAVLTPVIHRLWVEGWLIGDRSAAFMLRQLGPRPAVEKVVTPTLVPGRDVTALGHPGARTEADPSLVPGAMGSLLRKSLDEEFNHETDWGSWKPGDARAARAILEGDGRYAGLAQMIENGDLVIDSIAAHRVDELARVLSQAAGEGWSNSRTAAALREVLTDPRWARMVAITEVSRASSASSLSRYRDNGVDAKSWMTASDQRVCPECHENEAEGDIPIGAYFQDGSDAPPGHPTCRCAIAPGWLPAGAGTAGGGVFDVGDLAGLSEEDSSLGVTAALEAGGADESAVEVEGAMGL